MNASAALKSVKRIFHRKALQVLNKSRNIFELRQSVSGEINESGSESDGLLDNISDVGSSLEVEDPGDSGRDDGDDGDDDDRQSENNNIEDELDDGPDGGNNILVPIDVHESDLDSNSDHDEMNEDGTIRFHNDFEKEQFIINSMREWAREPGVLSLSKLDCLLHRFCFVYPHMPLSHVTLLEEQYDFNIVNLPSGGKMWYNSIKTNLDRLDLRRYLRVNKKIIIDINADGLPLFNRSSKNKFWPILGKLVGTTNEPFLIAVYCGFEDPANVDEFLASYVAELKDLKDNKYELNGEKYEVIIRDYICDAPARSFLKCTVGHSGYCACEKCEVWGEHIDNRVTFLDLNQPLRTDDSFNNRHQPRHHSGTSPLEEAGTKMVSQFRLDGLHLLYKGVVSRLIDFWLNCVGPWKLHNEVVQLISDVFIFLAASCPADFNRKPRSLEFFKNFKCTELRRIVLYDGIVAFKDLVDENIYKHFLLLHCALYILSNAVLMQSHPGVPQELINLFISHSAEIYGRKFVVYNVHSLVHLPAECEERGTIEEFSAFCFENRLKSLKQSLRSGYKPLEQAARRDKEGKSISITLTSDPKKCFLSLKRKDQVPEITPGTQYRAVTIGNTKLQVDGRNACFYTKRGEVVVLENVISRNDNIFLVGRKFTRLDDFYDYPLPSSELGIYCVSELEEEKHCFSLQDVDSKCWLIPNGNLHFCVVKLFNPKDEEEVFFEVALSSWLLGELDDNMEGQIRWPPKTKSIKHLIKNQALCDSKWQPRRAVVKRFYETFPEANDAAPKFVNDSNYETEAEGPLGRGHRKKRTRIYDSADSDEEPTIKLSSIKIPAPPKVNLSTAQRTSNTNAAKRLQEKQDLLAKLQVARKKAAEKMSASGKYAKSILDPTFKPSERPLIQNKNSAEKPHSVECSSAVVNNNSISFVDKQISSESRSENKSPSDRFTFDDGKPSRLEGSRSPSIFSDLDDQLLTGDTIDLNVNTEDDDHPLTGRDSRPTSPAHSLLEDSPDSSASKQNSPAHSQSGISPNPSASKRTSTVHSSDSKSFEDQLTKVEEVCEQSRVDILAISSKVDLLLMNTGRLIRATLPHEKKIIRPPDMPKLPLADTQQLKIYEKFLKSHLQNLVGCVDYMTIHINSEVPDAVKKSAFKILGELMKDELAGKINLDGGNDKISLRKLHLYKVVIGALGKVFSNDEISSVDSYMGKWLSDAKWRIIRRKGKK